MKKLVLVTFMVFVSSFLKAQKTIRMEREGGIYKISCKVNGAPMKMFFDTGATSVSISLSTAMYLFDNDLITKTDIRGTSKTQTADGSIKDNMIINLKDIEIAGLHLRDVQAVVSSSLNAPLLLGQSAIQKLGKITLQGNLLTIHNNMQGQTTTNQNRTEWDIKLRKLRDERATNADSDYEILEIIEKIERSGKNLNEFELFCKTMALGNVQKYDEAITTSSEWIDRFSLNTDSIDWKMRVYLVAADANVFSNNGNNEKGMEYLMRCWNYFQNKKEADFFWVKVPGMYGMYEKNKKQGFRQTIDVTRYCIKYYFKKDNITISMLNSTNPPIGLYAPLFEILATVIHENLLYNGSQRDITDQEIKILEVCYIMSAKLGNEVSRDFCRLQNWDYKRLLSRYELDLIGLD